MRQGLKAIKTLSAGSSKAIIQILVALVATPFLISHLGSKTFGSFKVIIEIFSHMGLLEFGLYGGLIAALAKAHVQKKDPHALSLEQVIFWGKRTYFRLGLMMALLNLLLLPFYYFTLKPQGAFEIKDLIFSVILLSLGPLFYSAMVDRAYLESKNEGHRAHLILLIQSLVNTILALILALIFPSMAGQIAAISLALGLGFLLFKKSAPLKIEDSDKEVVQKHPELFKQLRHLQKHQFINDLSGKICLMADNMVVAFFLGPATVTSFFVTQRVGLILQTQLQGLSNATWPMLASYIHEKKWDLFSRQLLGLMRITSAMACASLLTFALYNQSFISLWVGPSQYGGHLLSFAVALSAYFLSLLGLWGWAFTSGGLVWALTPMMITQALVNFIFSVALTKIFLQAGPVLGTLAAYLFIALPWMAGLLKKHFSLSYSTLMIHSFWPLIPNSLLALALFKCYQFYPQFYPHTWLGLCLQSATVASILLFLNSFMVCQKEERQMLVEMLKKITQRLKNLLRPM